MTCLSGKVAIVTGASRGIGSVIAEKLAEDGALVVVNYSSSAKMAQEVVNRIQKKGGKAVAIRADVSSLSEIENLFSETISIFKKIDILINNAGIMVNKSLEEVTETDFDQQFSVNVKGTFFACQQAYKHMKENGRIINFSTSVTGLMFPTYSVYAATKGAVEQISRQLAKEFGHKNITINTIAPGPVNTELFTVGKTEQQIQGLKNMNAFGRLAETEDISEVVSFLVSNQASWITGQTIRVNGGLI
ncbi:SDR family oxidoreductase [Neobacillus drentensis]|uniref:SDR family oxidoreductase n=1 Tax=Neobacillus drentensis TaxID=220684 RepID=UPI002FFDFC3B